MNDRDRLVQLRSMLDRLERMPASPHRDWMLSEVRARAVDVETGVAGRMRPLPGDEADAELDDSGERSPVTAPAGRVRPGRRQASRGIDRRSPSSPMRARPAHPAPRAPLIPASERDSRAGRDGVVDLLAGDGLLCLDDAAPSASCSWRRGLRG